MAIARSWLACSLVYTCCHHLVVSQSVTLRREQQLLEEQQHDAQHHGDNSEVLEVQPAGSFISKHSHKRRDSTASSDDTAVALTSGMSVKIMNRKMGTYLAACDECTGVVGPLSGMVLDDTCPAVQGPGKGCGFLVDHAGFSVFQIIKVGFPLGTPLVHNDLVALKSGADTKRDANYFSYFGVCGNTKRGVCPSSAAFVRLFKGDANISKIMPAAVMFTISKEVGQGTVMLSEFVSFIKVAQATEKSRGTYLASCGIGSTGTGAGKCGAKSNIYTTYVFAGSPQDKKFAAQWMVQPTDAAAGTATAAVDTSARDRITAAAAASRGRDAAADAADPTGRYEASANASRAALGAAAKAAAATTAAPPAATATAAPAGNGTTP